MRVHFSELVGSLTCVQVLHEGCNQRGCYCNTADMHETMHSHSLASHEGFEPYSISAQTFLTL